MILFTRPQEGAPVGVVPKTDRHSTLSADVAAGGSFTLNAMGGLPARTFIGVAPAAKVVYGGLSVGGSLNELQHATDYLQRIQGAKVVNLSLGFGEVTSDTARTSSFPLPPPNGNNDNSALYLDWFAKARDTVVVKSAGNEGKANQMDEEQPGMTNGRNRITRPGDFYNAITVGATDDSMQTRAEFSSYWLAGDTGAVPDVRGKPDIVAPGTEIFDGKNYDPLGGGTGTSFAAPAVSGTAALVAQKIADGQKHLASKAAILNYARKRRIVGANSANSVAMDHPISNFQPSDVNYLNGAGNFAAHNPGNTSGDWTPSDWPFAGGKFSATKPLDDEQGTGLLDAQRAILQIMAAEQDAGNVGVVGWDRHSFATPGIDGNPAVTTYDYSIAPNLPQNTFLTATLTWDRLINETDKGRGQQGNLPASAVGQVDFDDEYTYRGLANLDLLVMREDPNNEGMFFDYAESISITDNVEHLHIPITQAGKYRIRVKWSGKDGTVDTVTPFGLAWHAVPEPAALVLFIAGMSALPWRRRGK